MKYCRYCAFCINGDAYYCTDHDKVLNRVDRPTNCPDFVMSKLGDVDTGKHYKPREPRMTNNAAAVQQITLFEEVKQNG